MAAAAGLALTACDGAGFDPDVAQKVLPPCGAFYENPLNGWTRYPAVDEGQGRVGLSYDNGGDHVNVESPRAYYRLYDCRSGTAVGFDADGRDLPSVETFLAGARAQGLAARPELLISTARKSGYRAAHDRDWDQAEMAAYAACACQHFYPDAGARAAGKDGGAT